MPQKQKLGTKKKVRIVEPCLKGEMGISEASWKSGAQYTSRAFHHKLQLAGMTQSMSRVAHCIDNGPMEGFWGVLKRERYYGRRFTNKQELFQMITNCYYNTRRVQRGLGVLTPLEKHQLALAA